MAEITLGDLLAWEPRLRVAVESADQGDGGPVLAGRIDGVAGRELTWVVAARATTPTLPPLRGGELVLLPQRILNESGVAFGPLLRELAAHGAAGVVMEGEAVPPGVRAAGAPVPLVELAGGPIAPELEGELNRLLTERRGELYRTGTDVGRLLAGLTTAGAELDQILDATSDALDLSVVVVDRQGSVLASAQMGQNGGEVGAVWSRNGNQTEGCHQAPLAGGETLWLGPVPRERRALARVVGERIAVAVEAALAKAASARPRGAARAAALAAFLTSAPATDAAIRAAGLGLIADVRYRVALVSPALPEPAAHRLLAPLGQMLDAATIDGARAALIESRPVPPPAPLAASEIRRLPDPPRAARGATDRGWLALSGPAVPVALPAAARQARYVAALLDRGLLAGTVRRFDAIEDLGPYRLLYGYWGNTELETFAGEALGELPTRDRRGVLRHTLLTYLETGGSHVEAAARLAIHRNTLAYRLKQIATVTSLDPADPSTRLTLHLALLAASLPPPP